jgi:DNA helicase-2/ATP-dependent DNA helicase PcrA
VAITRAKDRLVMTSARTRRTWSEIRMNRPSRFIDDIPAECLAVRAVPRPPAARVPVRRAAARPQARPQYDELDQRTDYDDVIEYDAYADLEPDDDVGAGAFVEHAKFGTGRVLESRGSGKDRKLVIEFPGEGIKTILARFVAPTGP